MAEGTSGTGGHASPPRTYDGMVTNFLMMLTRRRPEKLREIQNVFKNENSTLDMFAFLWDLKEAHIKMTPPILKSRKSDEDSFTYWRLGNTHLQRRDKDLALKYFNMAIQMAPHPPSVIDGRVCCGDVVGGKDLSDLQPGLEGEPGAHNPEGWGDYVSLAYAYEARACLLLEMEQYNKCLRDIELVLQIGCPLTTASKLHDMKATCELLRSTTPDRSPTASPSRGATPPRGHSPTPVEPPLSFKYRCPEPPPMLENNVEIPAFSSSVKLAFSKNMGRHLVARQNITHGELLAVEEGYCSTVKLQYLRTYCSSCLKRTMAPLPCPSCSMVVFCSEHCRTLGLAGVHWQECVVLPTLHELDMGIVPFLAMKILLKTQHVKLREMAPHIVAEARNYPPERRGFNPEGVYDHSHYRTVYNLVTNKERRGYKDLLNKAMEAFMILKLMKYSERYFIDSEGRNFKPTLEDYIFTGSLLMHHMMNLSCNSADIFEVEIIGRDVDKDPIKLYGSGVFPSISLMSHACYSSCVILSYGNTRVVKACRAIPAGEPITCQYIDVVRGNLVERRAKLLPQYFFVCRCEACEMNWPEGLQYTTLFNLKCVKCHKSINANTKKCARCGVYYNRRSSIPATTNLYTYDYNTMKKRIEQSLRDYKRAEHRLMRRGGQSEADIRIVSNLIELYDEFVELPSYIHVAAQSTYNSMCYVMSSSAYSIEDSTPSCQVS